VWVIGSRKKKLIVALHFQFADQAGWECAACRKSGLEERRRCGWLAWPAELPARVVWVGGDVAVESCPKSLITAQSAAWVEEFLVRRRLGETGIAGLGARDVEALLILEHELSERISSSISDGNQRIKGRRGQ